MSDKPFKLTLQLLLWDKVEFLGIADLNPIFRIRLKRILVGGFFAFFFLVACKPSVVPSEVLVVTPKATIGETAKVLVAEPTPTSTPVAVTKVIPLEIPDGWAVNDTGLGSPVLEIWADGKKTEKFMTHDGKIWRYREEDTFFVWDGEELREVPPPGEGMRVVTADGEIAFEIDGIYKLRLM